MYQGENATAIQSQLWFADALLALMENKPFPQITIKDICQKADLSRQTFYNLFDSKEDVLRFRLRQNYEKLYEGIADRRQATLENAICAFADELTTDEAVVKLMIANNLSDIISDEISICVSLFADRFFSNEKNAARLPYGEAFISGGLARILLHWVKDEQRCTMDELVEIIQSICSGTFFD